MKTQFVTDNNGNKVAVILPLKSYQKMIEDLDELEDIKLYDKTKATKETSIPAAEAFKQIEAMGLANAIKQSRTGEHIDTASYLKKLRK